MQLVVLGEEERKIMSIITNFILIIFLSIPPKGSIVNAGCGWITVSWNSKSTAASQRRGMIFVALKI